MCVNPVRILSSSQPPLVPVATSPSPRFPPAPLTITEHAEIVRRWHAHFPLDSILELPCAACASLFPKSDIVVRRRADIDLSPLERPGCGITRMERHSAADPVGVELPGPILYQPAMTSLDGVPHLQLCPRCDVSLSRGELPLLSLANGRWIGDVPSVLRNLSYSEELLISRFRRNYCVAHVKGGQGYLKANAILFEQPTTTIYDVLPPPREDLDGVFALIFTGSARPTNKDYERTPFLVRHRVVLSALRWLQLNHSQYADVTISEDNLARYADNEPPVTVMYRKTSGASDAEADVGVHEPLHARSVPSGESCPFMVHALTASDLGHMNYSQPTNRQTGLHRHAYAGKHH
ncbi:hypothetical protein GY45DRAFT_1353614 [Cubamyces sp. BRFM 1775]|nr:hypothetical protein GY45DRAFT_1353614 [Cubamyces sp. BRFM 1775]